LVAELEVAEAAWKAWPLIRSILRARKRGQEAKADLGRPKRFHDPVTGDPLSLGEEASWLLQGFIRRWTVFAVVSGFTAFAWIHGRIWDQGWTDIWNLFASYWALALETIVGIALFSQTRRDAVHLRQAHFIIERVEQMEQRQQLILGLICSRMGIKLPKTPDQGGKV
jgi:hypothetical protein